MLETKNVNAPKSALFVHIYKADFGCVGSAFIDLTNRIHETAWILLRKQALQRLNTYYYLSGISVIISDLTHK